MPDFDYGLLRDLSTEMQRLAALPKDHAKYGAAQVALEDLRVEYKALRDQYQAQYATAPANPNRELAGPEATQQAGVSSDLGPIQAGVMSASNTMSFGLGKPAAQVFHALVPGGPTGGDVGAQWQATTEAHPTASAVGTGVGIGAGLVAGKIAASMAKSLGPLAASPVLQALSKLRGATRAVSTATKAAKAVSPASSVVAKVSAQKAIGVAEQATQSAAQELAASLAQAQQTELAAQALAKTTALIRQGFSMEDAAQMVQVGTAVPKKLWQPLLNGARRHLARVVQRAPASPPLPPQ